MLGKLNAYMLWDVADDSHEVVGTEFSLSRTRVGNEELENWLLRLLAPKTNFRFEARNSAMASRIIKDALEAGAIRQFDETASRKYMKYVPWWA